MTKRETATGTAKQTETPRETHRDCNTYCCNVHIISETQTVPRGFLVHVSD